jgi:hypothetical protein
LHEISRGNSFCEEEIDLPIGNDPEINENNGDADSDFTSDSESGKNLEVDIGDHANHVKMLSTEEMNECALDADADGEEDTEVKDEGTV